MYNLQFTYSYLCLFHSQHNDLRGILAQDLLSDANIETRQQNILKEADFLSQRINIQFIGVVGIFQDKGIDGHAAIVPLRSSGIPNIGSDSVILIYPRCTAIDALPVHLQPTTHVPQAFLENGQNGAILSGSHIDQDIAIATDGGNNFCNN